MGEKEIFVLQVCDESSIRCESIEQKSIKIFSLKTEFKKKNQFTLRNVCMSRFKQLMQYEILWTFLKQMLSKGRWCFQFKSSISSESSQAFLS